MPASLLSGVRSCGGFEGEGRCQRPEGIQGGSLLGKAELAHGVYGLTCVPKKIR